MHPWYSSLKLHPQKLDNDSISVKLRLRPESARSSYVYDDTCNEQSERDVLGVFELWIDPEKQDDPYRPIQMSVSIGGKKYISAPCCGRYYGIIELSQAQGHDAITQGEKWLISILELHSELLHSAQNAPYIWSLNGG